MNLQMQVSLSIFSFLYGMFFALTTTVAFRLLHHPNLWIRYLFTFGFIMLHILVYFLILRRFFYGILHPYSILLLTLGVFMEHAISSRVEIRIKK